MIRRILAVTAAVAAIMLAAACGAIGNPIGNPIHGPAVSDCSGTQTRLTHHVLNDREHIGLVTGLVVYECQRRPKLFVLTITIQTRRPGHVAWRDISVPATAELSEALPTAHPILNHPYLLVTRFECHGPYTAYWRLKQVYKGESSTGEIVPSITVYYPENDKLEQGIRIRCGENGGK